MTSDLPSISDLIKPPAEASTGKSYKPAVPPKVDLDDPQVKFAHKIEDISIKEKEDEAQNKAAAANLPYIDLSSFPVSAEALRVIPEEIARDKKIVCFYFSAGEIRVGVLEPISPDDDFIYQLGERHHATVGIYLISAHSLERVFKLYATLPIVKPITKDINITDEELSRFSASTSSLQTLQAQFKNVSVTDILTLMIASALKIDASDIHIEAEEKGIAVRYRIDGILQDVAELPKEQWKQFVSRIKLLAALKINITDRPQDGRVTLKLSSSSLDIRVSTLPTMYGESVVMRILHSGSKGVTFDELGLRGEAYERLKKEVTRPNGMIITTGPTGSGKTTTMYAILRTLNKPGVKIITLEDPVEIKMEGINQSQVDTSHDYTFAKGLKSILRQDPDICMVGEIRDLESAEISIQAALTGHLMLSTIHTNSASGAIPRFLSMGVKPFLLAPALNAVIGQRLVRRICENCIVEDDIQPDKMIRIKESLNTLPEVEKNKVDLDNLHFYKGSGCEKCSGLGYKGRVGIYEIFTITKEVEQIILSNQVSEFTIQDLAIKAGMVTMAQDGILKALDKITSIDEVFRVTE
ncbi:MAG: Type IV-A pilus assembly ATPase PilB [Candidatus Magasanikbacteria bacterium GW2011_GWC2_34_16]|uniref:Type IV-A pilus assembly ATPase PilB n=2 Tax=Candidatus Magasanikiibacteriota TaxID=1752731 RepID=A0A0G0HGB0_9BACT|nr:MAG: Type IV-A pilus assembly ATPase PilB [Candidatus Magasanikbacteria bacterium GW2011_GWC2_34_16]KKQ41242.1 MAG: Type IV-A pilus assembly ATPase PilB [Candidatus Magasanikbacteria bacterium GW2011_GWA2_37_8]